MMRDIEPWLLMVRFLSLPARNVCRSTGAVSRADRWWTDKQFTFTTSWIHQYRSIHGHGNLRSATAIGLYCQRHCLDGVFRLERYCSAASKSDLSLKSKSNC